MRVVMPLFEFSYHGNRFPLSDNYSLEHFDHEKDIPQQLPGLSKMDISYISLENWVLIADSRIGEYRSEVNLFLMALRIYAQSNAFIKWRFCKEASDLSARISDDDRFRNLVTRTTRKITEERLSVARNGFVGLLEMYRTSDRTRNALYFTWRGLCSRKHIDAYILLVCAIEALFSSETSEDVTRTVIKRTQRFLSGAKGFGGDQIKNIYKIRSDMVHGRVRHTEEGSEQARKNIQSLGKLEALVFACMRKFLDEKKYLIYKDVHEKETFLNDLVSDKTQNKRLQAIADKSAKASECRSENK